MFGLGTTELLLIAGAGLLLFGAKRLPEIGSSLGKGLKNFKKTFESPEEEEQVKKTTSPKKKAQA